MGIFKSKNSKNKDKTTFKLEGDELAKELAQAHYDLKEQEQMLNNMIEKARAQSKNLEFVHGG